MISFLILPIAIGVFSRIGGDALLYRSMFLEEINKDYVRTARAKGLSETAVLFKHVLRNASLPILTSTVAVLPMLFLGSLVMESFFGIPGLGSFTIDAINARLRHRPYDGFCRNCAVCHRSDFDGRGLHDCRPEDPFEMMPKFVLLPTDIVVVVLLAALTFYLIHVARSEESGGTLALCCEFRRLAVLAFAAVFLPSALRRRDSVHFRPVIDVQAGRPIYDVKAYRLLDKALGQSLFCRREVLFDAACDSDI